MKKIEKKIIKYEFTLNDVLKALKLKIPKNKEVYISSKTDYDEDTLELHEKVEVEVL